MKVMQMARQGLVLLQADASQGSAGLTLFYSVWPPTVDSETGDRVQSRVVCMCVQAVQREYAGWRVCGLVARQAGEVSPASKMLQPPWPWHCRHDSRTPAQQHARAEGP